MTLSSRWFLISSLLLAVLAGALFLPGLHGGFVFDDGVNIVNNQAIRLETLDAKSVYNIFFGLQPGGVSRILPTLSFAFDYWRGKGLDPAVFKTTNIVIHVLTTFVLAWFFRALLLMAARTTRIRAELGALAMAIAWAVHPLQVSSVLYIVQRMQTMATLFVLLALLAYLKARKAQIEGHSGRTGLMLAALLGVLALGCKEDAVLLPAYLFALELFVLGFRAADSDLSRRLRKSYLLATYIGIAAFLLAIVPHYWHWDAYPGRDFSSYERLLTQARVLCMYLWELLLPMPSHMPFYYDWLRPSTGLWHPWTTLPAILVVLVLLVAAWRLRIKRPLFSLGIFLFFAGHFIGSNVLNLELAFEHRNHFPLIGIILAAGDLLAFAAQRLRLADTTTISVVVVILVFLGEATITRAKIWSSPLALARGSTLLAPHSARAWNSLSLYYFELGGGNTPDNPYLDQAIDACSRGAPAAPYSITCPTNLVIFKSMRGNATQADWDRLLDRLQHVNLGPENGLSLWVIINNARNGVPLDENNVFKTIEIIANRMQLKSVEYAAIGYFIMSRTQHPERAYSYFARSAEMSPPQDALELAADLRKEGKTAWATKLEEIANASKATSHTDARIDQATRR